MGYGTEPNEPVAQTGAALASHQEAAIWAGRPSQWSNLPAYLLCGLFAWLVVPLFLALWKYLVVRLTEYELSNQRFRSTWGVVARRSEELELYRVRDISLNQSLFQRLFSLATLQLRTSDLSTPTTDIGHIPIETAEYLRDQIRSCAEQQRDRKKVRELSF
jgi:uncharacterized membrane protein YdbT with pleckstrin-like domain